MSKAPEPKFDFFTRVIAVSRIILPNHVSLQAPPNLSEDIAKLLNSGINDLGGISPVTIDLVNPDRLWPELKSLRRLVQTSNQVLMSRLPIYPNFISKEWMSLNMYERSQNVIDEHGYTNFTTMKSI
jgi:FO synthase